MKRIKSTHAYRLRDPRCGCVVAVCTDMADHREDVADFVASGAMSGLTIERVPIPMGFENGDGCDGKHFGEARIEPPTTRGDGKRLYRWRGAIEVFVAAKNYNDADGVVRDALDHGIGFDHQPTVTSDPFVKAVTDAAHIPEEWRGTAPLGFEGEEAVEDFLPVVTPSLAPPAGEEAGR